MRQLGESSPDALLFHELVHIDRFISLPSSYPALNYLMPETALEEEYHNAQEWDAIHGRSPDDFSENAYRKEAGLPQRVTHSGIPHRTAQMIRALSQNKHSVPVEVTAENEERVREVLLSIVSYGLEAEAREMIKRYRLRFSDFKFLAFHPQLVFYFDKTKQQFDGVRENILALLLGSVVQQKPSLNNIPTKVFLKNLFQYHAFESNDCQKRLCRYLPLSLILERTPIVQKAIREKNVELLEFLIHEKGLNGDVKIWHGKLKQFLTFCEYTAHCKWGKASSASLFSKQ